MNEVMNENQLTVVVKEYEFDNAPIKKIDSLIDDSIRDCHHKCFHTFDHICEYDLNFTNITNNEIVNFTISDKSLNFYELNKKLTIARERGFNFNQINKLTIKIYSNLSNINIQYHLRLGASPLHRQLFKKISHNLEYIQTHCNNLRNTFHFACRQWYSYNNPSILT